MGLEDPMLGMAGRIGTAVLVSLLPCVWAAGALEEDVGLSRAGSVGVVDTSCSDGACEVAGVSSSEGAATVEASDCSSSASLSVHVPVSSVASREGSATASFATCRFCLRLRRLDALGGNDASPSGVEYQGRSG